MTKTASHNNRSLSPLISFRRVNGKSDARGRWIAFWLMIALLRASLSLAAPAGTVISNTAVISYSSGIRTGLTAVSNTVEHITQDVRTPSSLSLLQLDNDPARAERHIPGPPAFSRDGSESGEFEDVPDHSYVTSTGTIDLDGMVRLSPGTVFKKGDPIVIQVVDPDQNQNIATAESVLVTVTTDRTGDHELLRINETGPNTGIFLGYIPSSGIPPAAQSYNGTLSVVNATRITCRYVDRADGSDESSANALVDPFGLVFDSTTGAPVDGARLTLLDAATNQPAVVLGDDGVSSYPSSVISGGSATDSSGRDYQFPAGGYRFPIVAPGTYRLQIDPPATHIAPSTVAASDLQLLPGGPFAIIDPGSRGEVFTLNPGPAMRIDIPVDPIIASFWVVKQAGKNRVALGEFVSYTLSVENLTIANITDGSLRDHLPHGFRYQAGSTKINGQQAADPVISDHGRDLTFGLGDMAPGDQVEISYVTAVGSGARPGQAVNRAVVQTAGGRSSNTATASVQVVEDFFRSRSFIAGRVMVVEKEGQSEAESPGVEGVRIYLEDGTYVVTDKNGRYHFEGVAPGAHVVQLDLESLPARYEILPLEPNTRYAGRTFSQFVDLQGGTLWRADFKVSPVPPQTGAARIELNTVLQDDAMTYTVRLRGRDVPLRNLRLTVMLPDGTCYLKNSSRLDQNTMADPRITGQVLTYDLDPSAGDWQKELAFRTRLTRSTNGGEMITKAVLSFDTPTQHQQRTPVVENRVNHRVQVKQISQEEKLLQLLPEGTVGRVEGMDNLLLQVIEEAVDQPPPFMLNPRFDTFSAELKPIDRREIDAVAEKLKELEIRDIVITGHTDTTPIAPPATNRYTDNYELSLARADSVARYLSARLRISPQCITIKGKGPDEPLASNDTAAGRARNRRVSIEINSRQWVRKSSMQQIPSLIQTDRLPAPPTLLGAAERAILDKLVRELDGSEVRQIEVAYMMAHSAVTPNGEDINAISMARAQLIGRYLAESLELKVGQLTLVGKSPNDRDLQSASADHLIWDFRVDIHVQTVKIDRRDLLQPIKGRDQAAAPTIGLSPGEVWLPEDGLHATAVTRPAYDRTWLETAPAGFQWLQPAPGFIPAVPSLKIDIAHDPREHLTLLLNGKAVNPLNFEGQEQDSTKTKALSHWSGIDLQVGDNRFEVVRSNPQGRIVERFAHTVYYPGPPVAAELVPEKSVLRADGRTTPVLAVRLKDRQGYPVRPGVTGEFSIAPPYEPFQSKQERIGLNAQRPHFVVEDDGVALIRLQPTALSGRTTLTVHLVDGDHTLRAWLQPVQRDWILVGLAEGTAGYNMISGNLENLGDAGVDEDYYQDGRLAFFAKGRIKGRWLLTLAFDSAKSSGDPHNPLFQTIDPDTYYTLYGDNTRQGHEAASTGKLYVKIERDQFYALFGDFDTDLTVTELSRYSRRFNGLKTELQTGFYKLNAFASDTRQAFMKDEIRGDGTSGLYRLSRNGILMNSERIRIETRDRFRSENIITSRELTRHIDYDIDYDDGTLFFKFPVASQDQQFNPTYIVVEYEIAGGADKAYTYGGRAAVETLGDLMEVGATYIHEGPRNGDSDLTGLDMNMQLGKGLQLKAEAAATRSITAGTRSSGNAYLAELSKTSDNISAKAYIKEQGPGFGLGQQNGSEAETRKLGLEGGYLINNRWRADAQILRQFNLATDAQRDLADAQVTYARRRYDLHSGFRYNEDRLGDGTVQRSQLLTAGGAYKMLDNRLRLSLDHEQALEDAGGSTDFPSRTTLGADYQLSKRVSVFGAQEYLWYDTQTAQNTRIGLKAAPWDGGAVSTGVERNIWENGQRLMGTMGLYQTWRINAHWHADAGLDRSVSLRDSANGRFNINQPSGSGSPEDFTAISLGLGYDAEQWSWTGRAETRNGETRDKLNLTTAVAGEIRPGLGLGAGMTLFQTRADAGDSTSGNLRLSLARRPLGSRLILLDRLEYIFEDNDTDRGRRLVNNLNANYKPYYNLQMAMQYGAKYVMDQLEDRSYDGYVDLVGAEMRYDLNPRWDVGFRAGLLHAWDLGQLDYTCGLSVGHSFAGNIWVSAGYNFVGFQDEDFSRAGFTAQGPFIRFRIKFDQQSVREILAQE